MAGTRNGMVAGVVVGAVLAMIGASYAAVPFYFAFCRATGFGGTTQVALQGSGVRGQRTIKVRFVANVAPGLDYDFEPETEAVNVRTGATTTVFFRFHNRADHDEVSRAVYNVQPEASGGCDHADSPECPANTRLTEKERLLDVMERTGWVQAKAARVLGITPRQIGYALRKYRIEMKRL